MRRKKWPVVFDGHKKRQVVPPRFTTVLFVEGAKNYSPD